MVFCVLRSDVNDTDNVGADNIPGVLSNQRESRPVPDSDQQRHHIGGRQNVQKRLGKKRHVKSRSGAGGTFSRLAQHVNKIKKKTGPSPAKHLITLESRMQVLKNFRKYLDINF
jgi:hypothetical protein